MPIGGSRGARGLKPFLELSFCSFLLLLFLEKFVLTEKIGKIQKVIWAWYQINLI